MTLFDRSRGKWQRDDGCGPGDNQGRLADRLEATCPSPDFSSALGSLIHGPRGFESRVRGWMVQSPCQRVCTRLHCVTADRYELRARKWARGFSNARRVFHSCTFSEHTRKARLKREALRERGDLRRRGRATSTEFPDAGPTAFTLVFFQRFHESDFSRHPSKATCAEELVLSGAASASPGSPADSSRAHFRAICPNHRLACDNGNLRLAAEFSAPIA